MEEMPVIGKLTKKAKQNINPNTSTDQIAFRQDNLREIVQ